MHSCIPPPAYATGEGDCPISPSGLKAGAALPSNIGIGVESYTIHDNANTIKVDMRDFSYLLPIPIVNIAIGLP